MGPRLVMLLPAVCAILVAQEPRPLEAPIRKVRLHPDEAWVTRVGRLKLNAPGTHRLRLSDLPTGLVLDDVRVAAKGPEGTRMGDVSLASEPRNLNETPEWKALEKEAEALQEKLDALGADRAALAQEATFLKNLQASYDKDLSGRLPFTPPNPTALVELSKGLHSRLGEVLTKDKRLERESTKLREAQARLQAEMRKRESERRQSPSRATVEITTTKPGELEVEFSYRTRQARWTPAYEARLSTDGKKLDLVLYAAVAQQSGEDWEGVSLEVSNARASRSMERAQYMGATVAGWHVPPLPMQDASMVRSKSATQAAGTVVEVVAAPAPLQNAYIPETSSNAIEEAHGLASTFLLDGKKDIPSDNEPHRFNVLSKALQPDLHCVAVPRLDPTVFQVARFPVPEGIPLFPDAPVAHFAGTARLGQAKLAMPATGQPFELSFGPFRGLRVSYQHIEAKKELVGAFTKERQWTLREKLEATNDTAEFVEVELQDRILKSEVEQVKVSSTPDSTPGEERRPGVRSWVLKLSPKDSGTVTMGSVIRAPQHGIVVGLDDLNLPE